MAPTTTKPPARAARPAARTTPTDDERALVAEVAAQARAEHDLEDYEPEPEPEEEGPFQPQVGQLVTDPATGRLGRVINAGREPNLDNRDPENHGIRKPEAPEPVISWFLMTEPAPFGGELTDATDL